MPLRSSFYRRLERSMRFCGAQDDTNSLQFPLERICTGLASVADSVRNSKSLQILADSRVTCIRGVRPSSSFNETLYW